MDINEILSSLTPDDIEELKATAEAVFGKGSEAIAALGFGYVLLNRP